MSAELLLDWLTMAVSLANTVLLLWLGATVILNAERRTWGVWLGGGSLLVGGVFFISHTAILGRGLTSLGVGMDFWWNVGLLAVIALPFSWYTVVLWYAGFWEDRQSALHHRQRLWFAISAAITVTLGGLLLFANPFPSYAQVLEFDSSGTLTLWGIPALIVVYPLGTALMVILALDALVRPGPSRRIMGEQARRRARPWLIATSAALLLVGLLVAAIMLWVVLTANQRARTTFAGDAIMVVLWPDLIISSLIALAVILLGQAIVRYEVFTGKTLPQRRFVRHWHNVVIAAPSLGAVLSGGLKFQHPVYSVLLTALLLTAFYVLFNQRSYHERDQQFSQLRPFVVSQKLYDRLLTGATPDQVDISTPFEALCKGVLDAQVAYLFPVGLLAALAGPPLSYPTHRKAPPLAPADLGGPFHTPQVMWVAVDALRYGGAVWGVPLWSERGLIGVLLLGEKNGGALYAQEEIEIARATSERLIDTQASAEMARRLMNLQRQRITESQIIDRRTRRMLHDDLLPRLHAAMLTLNAGQSSISETVGLLAVIHHQVADLLHEMPAAAAPEVAGRGLVEALHSVIDDELGGAFDGVQWQIQPELESKTRTIPLLTVEVVYYAVREAIRNAARYGRGGDAARALHLLIEMRWRGGLEIRVEDDGVGLETLAAPNGGSGHGLALHSTMMAVIGGSLTVESAPAQFTRVLLTLPSAPIAENAAGG